MSATILLVDPDARARAFLSAQLRQLRYRIVETDNGPSAMKIVTTEPVKVVVTELYLATGDDADLIHAVRSSKALRKTRTLAHTRHSLAGDREWAARVGADAYLIKPTRAERMRYVVGRLTTDTSAGFARTDERGALQRRDSLDAALAELEGGQLTGASIIVFGREWWEHLSRTGQSSYRRRAKAARITLRSDSMLGDHFVEVRGPSCVEGLSTERSESQPHRQRNAEAR